MKKGSNELVVNRKAYHEYEILETYEAGIALRGTEIKSLRNHGGSLQEAYVKVLRGEIFLIGCHIAPYSFGNVHNHEELRDRKLLLHRHEIDKLKTATMQKSYALVPISIYLKKGRAKLKLATARGKKHADKRIVLKERAIKKQMDQAMKEQR